VTVGEVGGTHMHNKHEGFKRSVGLRFFDDNL
jgi:hypothetical protein